MLEGVRLGDAIDLEAVVAVVPTNGRDDGRQWGTRCNRSKLIDDVLVGLVGRESRHGGRRRGAGDAVAQESARVVVLLIPALHAGQEAAVQVEVVVAVRVQDVLLTRVEARPRRQHRLGRRGHSSEGGAEDVVEHAEGGEVLEKRGAHELG